jgi:cytochrome P450
MPARPRSTFLFAGTDTTSNALARILQMLALHPDIQETLREELVGAGGAAGQLDYNQLVELPLLEAVCRETLRLCVSVAAPLHSNLTYRFRCSYPPVYVIQRE